ncbi:MAG TPA: PglZ domain-containing protein, partial [Anaerolineae bacterium]|nr:PglZ domain-containing protein [Anaerolineae bacterium]
DKLVAPHLHESGRRVALLLIDALRYELGQALHGYLASAGHAPAQIQPAFAQLPTLTLVGMASLLPGAGQALRLLRRNDQATPALGDQVLSSVLQRMAVLRARYGQRFAETTLRDFLQPGFELPATAELLVLRSNEMDRDFESNPEAAPSLLSRTFQQVRQAVLKLAELGFDDALVVTDHGFFLNPDGGAGDACARPPGNWLAVHERLLLGDGAEDAANALFDAATLGMRGDFGQAASPRAMTAYRAGATYLHGGVSLQEAVVPVISLRLRRAEPTQLWRPPAVALGYKQGARRITTRLPLIDVSAGLGELGSAAAPVELLLEAHDRQGNVVGEARPGGPVNPATLLVSLHPGDNATRHPPDAARL